MKTHTMKHIAAASFAAFAFCVAPVNVARAQNQQTQAQLEMLTPQAEAFTLGKLAGKPLRGAQQEQFSTIHDFLIEPQSGRVHFALSPSGSNTFRIVPMSAIDVVGNNELALRIDRGQWDRVGTLTDQQLQGRVSVDEAHQRRLMDQFSLGQADAAVGGLIRASTLKGREMRAGNDQLGTVEDVVIDFHNKIAAPVVKVTSNFAGSEQRFLVPFHRLQLSDGAAPITTSLTRNDFRQLRWQAQGSPTPTGYPGGQAGQFRQTFQPTAQAAVAIQQSLAQNQAIPQGSVQVIPESRIVLRGTVSNAQQKAQIEQQAQQAAAGVRVDSEIQVRNW